MATRILTKRFLNFNTNRCLTNNNKSLTRRTFATATEEESFAIRQQKIEEHAKDAANMWKKISIYGCVPALVLTTINALKIEKEHEAHLHEHPPEPIEHPPYEYQRIRLKLICISS
ncbi:12264_t:CDS:2 [Entrophospora sp. SA101]|nr:12264_t:CDS:2 [Entrophospora sp. SA101]